MPDYRRRFDEIIQTVLKDRRSEKKPESEIANEVLNCIRVPFGEDVLNPPDIDPVQIGETLQWAAIEYANYLKNLTLDRQDELARGAAQYIVMRCEQLRKNISIAQREQPDS